MIAALLAAAWIGTSGLYAPGTQEVYSDPMPQGAAEAWVVTSPASWTGELAEFELVGIYDRQHN